jgi:hypothetical protein
MFTHSLISQFRGRQRPFFHSDPGQSDAWDVHAPPTYIHDAHLLSQARDCRPSDDLVIYTGDEQTARGLGRSLMERMHILQRLKYITSGSMSAPGIAGLFSPLARPINQQSYHTLTHNLPKRVMSSSVSASIEGAAEIHPEVKSYFARNKRSSI